MTPAPAIARSEAAHVAADDAVATGFWLYIATDCVLFTALFAVFAVLHANTAGGPGLPMLLHPVSTVLETVVLLTSSAACAIAWPLLLAGRPRAWLTASAVVLALGVVFLGLEVAEFAGLVSQGASWSRSGALSSFFVLVGTHGLHVTVGLTWLAVLMIRTLRSGVTERRIRHAALFSIFWHFLDVVWILIFTVVYLGGAFA